MDIKIEAQQVENGQAFSEKATKELSNRFGEYGFLDAMDLKLTKTDQDLHKVGLQTKPHGGQMIYASAEDVIESRALYAAMKKLHGQLERYKEIHYKSSHKNKK